MSAGASELPRLGILPCRQDPDPEARRASASSERGRAAFLRARTLREESPRTGLAALALFLATCALFLGASANDFVDYDDPEYVTENPIVAHGLDGTAVLRAFRESRHGNWHPLTWLSHALDVELFDLDPAGHHTTSLLLHGANAALLFLFLARATACLRTAFLVAALFAWHPLRVESVAWVSERKDVLSGSFFLATLLAYARWCRAPTRGRYLATLGLYASGLMSKPMLVTLPFVLLLLDRWPLRRPAFAWREKLPFLALAAVTVVVTLTTQTAEGATATLAVLPGAARVENALVAAGTYARQTVWPAGLAVLYPHPGIFGESQLVPAALWGLVLAAAGALAWRERSRVPWLGVGLAWYGLVLLPVVGLLQVGLQAHADRYTYLSTIGLGLVLVHGAAALARRARLPVWAATLASALVLGALSVATWRQVGRWHDTITLFEHTARVTRRNFVAWDKLGRAQAARGERARAIGAFEHGLATGINARDFLDQLVPLWVEDALEQGSHEPLLRHALPDELRIEALWELGRRQLAAERTAEAVATHRAALAFAPRDPIAQHNLGAALERAGDMDGARAAYRAALELDPGFRHSAERLRALDAGSGDDG